MGVWVWGVALCYDHFGPPAPTVPKSEKDLVPLFDHFFPFEKNQLLIIFFDYTIQYFNPSPFRSTPSHHHAHHTHHTRPPATPLPLLRGKTRN